MTHPYVFSANTASPQYEDMWDERYFIKVRIAAPNNGWYYPCDNGWEFGYIEGFSNNFLHKIYYERVYG